MIQYINKIPSKIEYFDMMCSAYEQENVEVSQLSKELDETIAAVCAYNGDRMVGMGRVKREDSVLCIEDLIVKLEPLKEEIQKNIIINLLGQINQMKYYDISIRDCLEQRTPVYINTEKKEQKEGYEMNALNNRIVGA